MKLVPLAILILFTTEVFGQTSPEVLKNYTSLNSWQTNQADLNQILEENFKLGAASFKTSLLEALEFPPLTTVFPTYCLLQIRANQGEVEWSLLNEVGEFYEKQFNETLDELKPMWSKKSSFELNLVVSFSDNQFNLSNDFFANVRHPMTSSPDDCAKHSSERLFHESKNLLNTYDCNGAFYYCKILVKWEPFNEKYHSLLKEINNVCQQNLKPTKSGL